ncbi:predicted protein [Nematostella vectensis]|uniref:Uncharacterized protein n=1 Tax=Nematostella vectensis TaxID=45351 RepID=A7RNF0_NEMVE|nr:predicted protein [Nematostella vectensis]|eukprot:XP_001639194.1 predicted protein [Nematostella vectensis]
MPLIVRAEGSFGGSYTSSPHEITTPSTEQEPTETTPLKERHLNHTKLPRKLRMRRLPIACLILAEVCERFAYYGITINFVLFLDNFGWSMFAAAGGVLVYTSVAWFMCALGGLLADGRFGRHSTIISGLLVYYIGSVLLVLLAVWLDYRHKEPSDQDSIPILPWLVLIMLSVAAGEGAVKSNLSAFSAEQFQGESPSGSWKGIFTCLYWFSNVIALFGLAAVTYIQQTDLSWTYGYTLGFGIPLVSLTITAAAFLCSSKHFVINRPRGTGLRNVRMIIKQAWSKRNDTVETREFTSLHKAKSKMTWLDRASVQYGGTFLNSEVCEVKSLGKAFAFSLCLIPYWMIYSQLYTTYILQGLHLHADFGVLVVPAAWMSLLEIAVVLIMLPLMEKIIYPVCIQCNFSLPLLWSVTFGMLLAVASVAMAGYLEMEKADYFTENGFTNQTTSCKVYHVVKGFNILWQMPQYALLGMSEVFASMTGLEIVYSLCPSTPQSVTSAIYNIMICIGSILSFVTMAIVVPFHWYPSHVESDMVYLNKRQVARYYWLLGGIGLLSVAILLAVGYSCDIGIRKVHHHHHMFQNEEDGSSGVHIQSYEGEMSPGDNFETL